jgi:dTDP-4-dehydrorhamnose reductase
LATQSILITGANGLLGQKLINLYGQHPEYKVLATGRGAYRLSVVYPNITYRSMDITNEAEVNTVLAEFKPDVVIHTAAMTNVDECELNHEGCVAQNVDATRYIANACVDQGSFLLHLSTDFIFDGSAGPYTEEDTPNPISFYGESKLKAEEIVRQSATRWAIARTILVFGVAEDMSRTNIVLWVKGSLEAGKQIKVVNDQWRTPTLAEDLAIGCFLIAKGQHEGIFNISGEEMLTPYDMAQATAKYFNLDASLIEKADASSFTQPAKRPPKTGFVLTKAKTVLGYKPHTFMEGLAILDNQLKAKASK